MGKKVGLFVIAGCVVACTLISSAWHSKFLAALEKSNNIEENVNVDTEKNLYVERENSPINTGKLPIVYLETGGQQILKDDVIWSTFSSSDISTAATLKYRGSSSYYIFDKKQYRISFYKSKESKTEKSYDMFGMGNSSEWILNGPFLDRTLIRNHLLYNISEEIMEWAPDSRFCELYLDGQYQGIYLLMEPVSNGAARLRLSTFGFSSGQTSFIIKRDRVGSEQNVIHTYGEIQGVTSYELNIEYPASKNLTEVQNQWITNYINSFEKSLYGDMFSDSEKGYKKYIDVDSFVEYFIINEVSMNSDAGSLSTYCYQELGGKMHLAVWDFNNCYDNYPWNVKAYNEFFLTESPWFDRLLEDREFVKKVNDRYKELRQDILSNESMLNKINNDVAFMGNAVSRNFGVWGYTFNEKYLKSNLDGSLRDPRSYEEAVSQLKNAIVKRFEFLDQNLDSLYENCIN